VTSVEGQGVSNPRERSLVSSSLGMIAGKAALLGLGFVFWLFAAQLFPAAAVGLAGGAVSAIMLCVQVAVLGVGAALVVAYPKAEADPAALLDSAITVVTLAAVTVGALFLVVAGAAFDELRIVAMVPSFAVLFVVMSVGGTVVLLFDHVSMAQSRGFDVFARNGANAVVTIAPLALVPLVGTGSGGLTLFAAWVAGSLAAYGLGFIQLYRTLGYRYRPRFDRRLGAALVRWGLPNQALTLAERAPALVLPILVTELLSAADNAYWYTAWMMAWAVNVIPLSVGMALFAETAHRPDAVAGHVRRSLSAVVVIGLPSAFTLALLAPRFLSLLGADYALHGTAPLRILVLAVLPAGLQHAYYAVCRARGNLPEAIAAGAVSAAVAIAGTALAARGARLAGMAAWWIAVQYMLGLWAACRLRALTAHLTLRPVPVPAVGAHLATGTAATSARFADDQPHARVLMPHRDPNAPAGMIETDSRP